MGLTTILIKQEELTRNTLIGGNVDVDRYLQAIKACQNLKALFGLPMPSGFSSAAEQMVQSLNILYRSQTPQPITQPQTLKMVAEKISFDYDDTLTTGKGILALERALASGKVVYIISARQSPGGMFNLADDYGISHNKVYATGSNKAKLEKILELGITEHYDNNQDVIDQLNGIGKKI